MNDLIYGKDKIEKIVSIEIEDNNTILFIENENGQIETKFKSNNFWILSNQPLSRNFQKLHGNLHYKYGILIPKRDEFLKFRNIWRNHDIFSIYDPKESHMVHYGETYFKGMKHQDVSVLSFDIETTSLEMDHTAKLLIISNTFRKNGKIERKLFCYDEYGDEGKMLEAWCKWVRDINPSILIGHNICSYDLPYMHYIASKYNVSLDLGRDSSPIQFDTKESRFRKDATQFLHYHKPKVYGREIVDTMFLAIKYDVGRKYESYALKKIIAQEKLEVEGRQHYDAGTIRFKYQIPEEWLKIKKYALHDADDALALYDLMIPPFFYLTQTVPKSFQSIIESASGSQINAVMMRSYLQEGHSLPQTSMAQQYEGAISIGNPGIYDNVYKVDVASLYPSIMIQYEVYDKDKDPKAYFLRLVNTFTEKRLHHKKLAKEDKYHDDLQSAYKIFINSCYGFLGANGLLFNSPAKAAFITKTGREILSSCIKWAETNNFRLVNADTDSISFCKNDHSHMTEDERKTYLKQINGMFPERIRWEDDGYYLRVIVLKAKNYVLYDGKKTKIKGSALKATNKEPALKEFIEKCIDLMVHGVDEFPELYHNYVREISNVKDIKRWVTKKTVTDKVLKSDRTNEVKVRDALAGSEFQEGDKVYMFFKSDGSLCLAEKFDGDYDKDKLYEKLYKTCLVFDALLITEDIFPNYKLKKNKKTLEDMLRLKMI